jgi:hypothetical protein
MRPRQIHAVSTVAPADVERAVAIIVRAFCTIRGTPALPASLLLARKPTTTGEEELTRFSLGPRNKARNADWRSAMTAPGQGRLSSPR